MLKKKIKFGKSFKDVDKIKSNFFSENNLLMKDRIRSIDFTLINQKGKNVKLWFKTDR